MDYLVCTLVIGLLATAVMDLWGIARRDRRGAEQRGSRAGSRPVR